MSKWLVAAFCGVSLSVLGVTGAMAGYDDKDKILICHVPPGQVEKGKLSEGHVIEVGGNAAEAHFDNHDCDEEAESWEKKGDDCKNFCKKY
jgi:hypothetical protein